MLGDIFNDGGDDGDFGFIATADSAAMQANVQTWSTM